MSANPLTHHEILTLVEPFTGAGRQVDLAASDRPERRLVFKPRVHAARSLCAPVLTETLVLENPRSDLYRLTRTLTTGPGETAGLRVEGPEPAALVERLDRIDPQVHFQVRRGVTIARDYRLVYRPGEGKGQPGHDDLVLTQATADLGDVNLTLDAAAGSRGPAEVHLAAKPGRPFDPPDDLLAVLGWSWKPLRRNPRGWRALLRVPRGEPERSRASERKLEQTVEHLALTLTQPPARFHARFPLARWVCAGRRMTAILVVLGLLAMGPAIAFMDLPRDSIWRFFAFHMPAFLLVGFFVVRELPIMRPPRVPSPPADTAWAPVSPAAADGVPGPAGKGLFSNDPRGAK